MKHYTGALTAKERVNAFGIMKAPETNVKRPKALDIKKKTMTVTVLWSSTSV
jgi:hypothetical protein